ncbi:hypothetical protein CTEN210_01210 [Chaetoceros tenuissimus]|uniref:Helicase-associated domain-containing protein n=1 Tax=Chaetoceros tenuissimus TaxID=426638 RepID=A0AAD3CH47_9STRA|nr:hypothetical protein CTEN210_01210 [Chaetoceros tenuissimus]
MKNPDKTIEQLEKSEAECSRLEKEKMALEGQLKDAIETAKERKSKLRNWKERSRKLIERVKTSIRSLKSQIMSLETQLEAKVDTIQSLEGELEKARSNNANLTAQLEEILRKGECLEAQLQDASANNKSLQEALTVVQTDQKNELKNYLSQVLFYFEDCPNWAYKNHTRKERENQGTRSFHNSEPLAVEIANLWGLNEKEWDKVDPVTKQVVMNSKCVEEANEVYWKHGFIPSPFKGKVGRRWNSLHIGTCDSVEGNLTDLNLREFIDACESFVLNYDPSSSKGGKGDLGFMYMERSGCLLPYDCWSLIAKIKTKMKNYDENSEENATLYELYGKMKSYIALVEFDTRLVLRTVFREYVKVQQIDTVHDFSSDAVNGILLASSEIIAILSEEQPSRIFVPVKTAHLSYAAMNGRNFPLPKLDPFVLLAESINHGAAKAIHEELYSREKVTAMLNKASETNLTNLQQLLSRLAIIRAQTMMSKKIMTARIRMRNRWRARLRARLRSLLRNRQSNEEVSRKRKKEDDDLSEVSPAHKTQRRKIVHTSRGSSEFQNELWMTQYNALVQFKKVHGHIRVKQDKENSQLGNWVVNQRVLYKKLQERIKNAKGEVECIHMTTDRIKMLNNIGFVWTPLDDKWMARYNALKGYKEKNGHCKVKRSENKELEVWIQKQRTSYKKLQQRINDGTKDAESKRMTKNRIKLLNDIGFVW